MIAHQPITTHHSRKLMWNVVLVSTYLVIATISILLLISFSLSHNTELLNRLAVCGIAFAYIGAVHIFMRLTYHRTVGYLLILFYTLLATGIVWNWGVNTPMGTLIFGLVIVLAGILLTARHALFAAIAAGLILLSVQTATVLDYVPDVSWSDSDSSFGDVLAYCIVFSMLALVSWLYNREIERSLAQAKQAEAALLQQKATLKTQVKKRTAELRHAQLEEMRHMYRFAELGQLGATLLHDLANHLTALTLEIEGLQSVQHSQAITRARRIIKYFEDVIHSTRERLHGNTEQQTFNIIQKINEVVTFLHYKALHNNVVVDWQPPVRSWEYTGDPTSLSQVIAIVMSNAIDAYEASEAKKRRVAITIQRNNTHITLRICDWGKGIPKNKRKQIFKPFYSGKKAGLGLGLYIAKQTIEVQFSGAITLSPSNDQTEFIIKLPLRHGE